MSNINTLCDNLLILIIIILFIYLLNINTNYNLCINNNQKIIFICIMNDIVISERIDEV